MDRHLLHNLRTIGTHHCDQTVGEEAAQEIERLRETVRRLVDVMERSDLEQFNDAEPVSGEEWFDAIRDAKMMLA